MPARSDTEADITAAYALRALSRPPPDLTDAQTLALHWDQLDSATLSRLQQQYAVREMLCMANGIRERMYGTSKYSLTAEEVYVRFGQMMGRDRYERSEGMAVEESKTLGKGRKARKRKVEQEGDEVGEEVVMARPGSTASTREKKCATKMVVLKFKQSIALRGGKWWFGGWMIEPVEKRPRKEIASQCVRTFSWKEVGEYIAIRSGPNILLEPSLSFLLPFL